MTTMKIKSKQPINPTLPTFFGDVMTNHIATLSSPLEKFSQEGLLHLTL